jgi:hypothetical protein
MIEARREIQERMSTCGAAVRDLEKIRSAVGEAWSLWARLKSELTVRSAKDLPEAFRVLDLGLTHAVYLEAIHEYLEKGGRSRGSYLVLDKAGAKPCPELGDAWRFALNPRLSFVDRKVLEVSLDNKGGRSRNGWTSGRYRARTAGSRTSGRIFARAGSSARRSKR